MRVVTRVLAERRYALETLILLITVNSKHGLRVDGRFLILLVERLECLFLEYRFLMVIFVFSLSGLQSLLQQRMRHKINNLKKKTLNCSKLGELFWLFALPSR